jgi:hypothetical protein
MRMDHQESRALHERVRRFIGESLIGTTGETFDRLACDIARFQARHIRAVRNCFLANGVDPYAIDQASAIPALPTDVFRLRRIAAHDKGDDERVFLTSGTTSGARGAHAFRTTETYRIAALAWAERMLWPDRRGLALVLLAADELRAPESSLSFMLARFAEVHPRASWHWDGSRLDADSIARAIGAAKSDDLSVLVAGTSFALVHLYDTATDRDALALPPGSRVMQTGGFKGRSREVDPAALRSHLAELFSIPGSDVVAEYGMTELSSQAYQALARPPTSGAYHPPPWLRFAAVDPISLSPKAPGEEGICRIVDLANVDSAVAMQTVDRVVSNEDGSIELLGRAAGAPPRGCSLAIEQALAGHE